MISALVFAGCDFSESQSEPPTLENPYSYVANQHSAGLEYALDQLKASPKTASRRDLRQLAKISSREYAERQGLALEGFDAVEVGIDAASAVTSTSEAELSTRHAASASSSQAKVLPDSLTSRLSGDQIRFIDRIMELVEAEPSVEELESDLETLNGEVRAELKEDEARVVLIASAVALDSWTYWMQNGDEWIETIREKRDGSASAKSLVSASANAEGDDGFSWGDVGKADIAGGVGGAAGGAVTGAMVGGAGAAPGAAAGAAGGAVGGSVTSATSQVLDQWW